MQPFTTTAAFPSLLLSSCAPPRLQLVQLRIAIIGVGGVGIEVAKNIVLAGPGVVTLVDAKKCVAADLGTNFYLTAADVAAGATRVDGCVERVRDLNRHVDVRAVAGELTEVLLEQHDVAIFCDCARGELLRWNALCRAKRVTFIAAAARGVTSYIFSDFGAEFAVANEFGETAIARVVTNITCEEDGLLTIVNPENHIGAEKLSGDGAIDFDSEHSGWITIEDVAGMRALDAGAAAAPSASINDSAPRRVRQCLRLVLDRKHRRGDPADVYRGQFYVHVRDAATGEFAKDADRPDGLRWRTVWDDEVDATPADDFVVGHSAAVDPTTKNVRYDGDAAMATTRLQLMKVVVDPYSCYIGDTRGFAPYEGGGQAVQHFEPMVHRHRSLAEALAQPLPDESSADGARLMASDERMVAKQWYETLHVAQLALWEFEQRNGRLPAPNDEAEAAAVVDIAKELSGRMRDCVPPEFADALCAKTIDLRAAAQRWDGDGAALPPGSYKPTATYSEERRALIAAAEDGCATPYHAAFALNATGWRSADDAVMWQYMDGCDGSDGAAQRDAYVAGAYAAEALVHVHNIARVAACSLQPLCAFIGGTVAQEAIKHTGRFTPLNQWFHFDCVDALPDALPLPAADVDVTRLSPTEERYSDVVRIVGRSTLSKLQCAKTFMVGCGALGCEFLKNFAMLGVACDAEGRGRVTVTDGDRIEVSNLNRQFLFREQHVGTPKSTTARDVVQAMNPAMRVDALELLAMPATEETFDDAFWRTRGVLAESKVAGSAAAAAATEGGLTFVTNALDSVKARKCVDASTPHSLLHRRGLTPMVHTRLALTGTGTHSTSSPPLLLPPSSQGTSTRAASSLACRSSRVARRARSSTRWSSSRSARTATTTERCTRSPPRRTCTARAHSRTSPSSSCTAFSSRASCSSTSRSLGTFRRSPSTRARRGRTTRVSRRGRRARRRSPR
jgi:molybdopterin/thiamine biosynthesis adenylyltransferase